MNVVTITVPVLAMDGDTRVKDMTRLAPLDGRDLRADYSAHLRVARACSVSLHLRDRLELDVRWYTNKPLASRTLAKVRKQTWVLLLDGVDGYEVDGLFVAVDATGSADDLTVTQQPGELPLSLTDAARRGEQQQVEQALLEGQPIGLRDGEGKTALHLAIENGHHELARWLLDQEAPLEAVDTAGRTPLLAALGAYMGPDAREQLVLGLLDRGAEPDVVDAHGCDPLWESARNGHLALVKRFLALGLDPDRRGHEGLTPAMITLDTEVLRHLLKHGIDTSIRNDAGRTLAEHLEHKIEAARTNRFADPATYEPLVEVLTSASRTSTSS